VYVLALHVLALNSKAQIRKSNNNHGREGNLFSMKVKGKSNVIDGPVGVGSNLDAAITHTIFKHFHNFHRTNIFILTIGYRPFL